jgi:hypothetical protein
MVQENRGVRNLKVKRSLHWSPRFGEGRNRKFTSRKIHWPTSGPVYYMCDFFRRDKIQSSGKHRAGSMTLFSCNPSQSGLDIAAETSETLLRDIHARIVPEGAQRHTEKDLWDGLQKGWATWGWAQHHRDKEYIEGFSLQLLYVFLL